MPVYEITMRFTFNDDVDADNAAALIRRKCSPFRPKLLTLRRVLDTGVAYSIPTTPDGHQ